MSLKILLLSIVACALSNLLSGQNNYYTNENELSSGVNLIKGNDIQNSKFCQVIYGKEIIKLLPNEITEFGFKDGSVYFSKKILLSNTYEQVFLERLVKGTINLLYYKDQKHKIFFLETSDSILIELPKYSADDKKNKFKDILSDLTPACITKNETFKLVNYRKKPLTEYIECLNNCDSRLFRFTKFGLFVGYGFTKLSPTNNRPSYLNFDVFQLKYDGSFNAGLSIDKPIFRTNLSLHFETSYSKNKISDYRKINNKEFDMELTYSCLNIPLLVRYTYPQLKNSPYINVGPMYTFNFINTNSIHEIEGNDITDFSNYYEIIPDNLFGYSIGIGLQKKLTFRNFLSLELRFNKLFGPFSYEFINKGELNLLIGINF
jgi:hypothetical protein